MGVGENALNTNVTGSKNIGLGSGADVLSSDLNNAVAIGSNAKVGVHNGIVLGDSDLALVGIGTAFPTAKLDVHGSFRLADGNEGEGKVLVSDKNGRASWQNLEGSKLSASIYSASDSTLKKNIRVSQYGLAALMQLRPVTFNWKADGTTDVGFVAQEVAKIVPELVHGTPGNLSLSYGQMTSVLTKAVQEQQQLIVEQKQQLARQQQTIDQQKADFKALEAKVEKLNLLLNQVTKTLELKK